MDENVALLGDTPYLSMRADANLSFAQGTSTKRITKSIFCWSGTQQWRKLETTNIKGVWDIQCSAFYCQHAWVGTMSTFYWTISTSWCSESIEIITWCGFQTTSFVVSTTTIWIHLAIKVFTACATCSRARVTCCWWQSSWEQRRQKQIWN
jgi:hypothetical protein